MTYLIDGYNLMHAAGLVASRSPASFRSARTRFLNWLADRGVGRGAELRVVFDAQSAPSESQEIVHRGVRVLFASGQTADELIEELVGSEAQPASVTVVTNDGQVREAARRRGCKRQTCENFIDWLIEDPPPPRRK